MTVSLEWLNESMAILRHHPEGDYGSPYDMVGVAVFAGETATIKGFLCRGPYTSDMRRQIAKAMRDNGARRVLFDRKNGAERTISRIP